MCLALSGCMQHSVAPPSISQATLLDGSELFGHEVAAADEVDVLAVSPEMAAFLKDRVPRGLLEYSRFRHLMAALVAEGRLVNDYQANGTFVAAETFARGKATVSAIPISLLL